MSGARLYLAIQCESKSLTWRNSSVLPLTRGINLFFLPHDKDKPKFI